MRWTRFDEACVVRRILQGRALRDDHVAVTVEDDAGDGERIFAFNAGFEPDVRFEVTVGLQANGPDLRPLRDGIKKPPIMDGQRIDTAFELREPPGMRFRRIETRRLYAEAFAVVLDGRFAAHGPPRNAVVELAEVTAVLGNAQAMDETGVKVGRIERAARRIERQAADTRAAVFQSTGFEVCKQTDGTRRAIDLPDRSRACLRAGTELTFDEFRARGTRFQAIGLPVTILVGSDDVQTKGRCSTGIKSRSHCTIDRLVIECEAENMSNILRLELKGDGRVHQLPRHTACQCVDAVNTQGNAIGVDHGLCYGINARRDALTLQLRAGKSRRRDRAGAISLGAPARTGHRCRPRIGLEPDGAGNENRTYESCAENSGFSGCRPANQGERG